MVGTSTAMQGHANSFEALPRISLLDLQTAQCTEVWEKAVETLSLSLAKNHVAIVQVPNEVSAVIATARDTYDCFFQQTSLHSLLPRAKPGSSNGFTSQPGRDKFEYRVGSKALSMLPQSLDGASVQASYAMETAARMVLSAVCRSCQLRLRSDSFTPLLDDLPLAHGTVSSSVLQASKCCNNLGPSTPGIQPLSFNPLEECTHRGLLSLLCWTEAYDSAKQQTLSKLQVKTADGQWCHVKLQRNEIAVVYGLTLQRATAGILTAATYRVVGDAMGGSGRSSLSFELHAQASAVIDLHKALEKAGHNVAERFANPVTITELMQQFENVLTPVSHGGEALTGRRSVEYTAIRLTEEKRKARKRTSGVPAFNPSPVTRSGKVRRTTAGLVHARVLDADGAAPSGPPADEAAEEAAAAAEPHRMCLSVDVQGDEPNLLMLVVKHIGMSHRLYFRVTKMTLCGRIFETYCETMGLDLGDVAFLYMGVRIYGSNRPGELGLDHESEILVVPNVCMAAECPDEEDDCCDEDCDGCCHEDCDCS